MIRSFVERVGRRTIEKLRGLCHLVAVSWTAIAIAWKPRYWNRTVRNVFARQLLFTGFEAVKFVSLIALLVGISIVVQTEVWLAAVGQTQLLGPVLVAVVVREIGPLLTNFVVLGRSGTAIATELANMKVTGEVKTLDAFGLDPFIYLCVTRILSMAIAIFCLTIVFIVVCFLSGYLFGAVLGASSIEPGRFVNSVFGALKPADVANVLAKTLIPGLLTGAICCTEGLGVGHSITQVPQAASRAVVRSAGALFITSALVSVLTYL